ncbi:cell division protein ZapA [uncultured Finegoldia sp.]|uniref:cell division protein ZapA n=1 Tax=uncultured Finegoldia sp. TaxID=328009 RepID=UPI002611E010|nr:cell division protein ZapA [uncultured Finegoldia sp.]
MNKLQVVIQGTTYNIVTDKTKEQTDEIVSKINKNISDCKNNNPKLTTLNATILSLMNLEESYANTVTEFRQYKEENAPIVKDYKKLKLDCEKLYQNLVVKESDLKKINKQVEELKQKSNKEIDDIKSNSNVYISELKTSYEKKINELTKKIEKNNSTIEDLKNQIEYYKNDNDSVSKEYKKLKDDYNNLAFEKNKIENILMDYQRNETID